MERKGGEGGLNPVRRIVRIEICHNHGRTNQPVLYSHK